MRNRNGVPTLSGADGRGDPTLDQGDARAALCRGMGGQRRGDRGPRSGDARRPGAALPSPLAVGRTRARRRRRAGALLPGAGRHDPVRPVPAAPGAPRRAGDGGGERAAPPPAGAAGRGRAADRLRSRAADAMVRSSGRNHGACPRAPCRACGRAGAVSHGEPRCPAAGNDRAVPGGGRLGRVAQRARRAAGALVRRAAVPVAAARAERTAGAQPGGLSVRPRRDREPRRRLYPGRHRRYDDRASCRCARRADMADAQARARLALVADRPRQRLVPVAAPLPSTGVGRLDRGRRRDRPRPRGGRR